MSDNNYVKINDKVKLFPKFLYSKDAASVPGDDKEPRFDSSFILAGVGTKSLPIPIFLKVYSIGIYIELKAREDLVSLIKGGKLDSKDLVKKILDDKTPILIKISPTMDSNLKTPREKGFIACIKRSQLVKNDKTLMEKCINEVKEAFGLDEKFIVNDDLYLEFNEDQTVQFHYFNSKTGKFITMGKTTEPLVSQILLNTYLADDRPAVPEARASFIKNFSS